jgi:hypothetical protein
MRISAAFLIFLLSAHISPASAEVGRFRFFFDAGKSHLLKNQFEAPEGATRIHYDEVEDGNYSQLRFGADWRRIPTERWLVVVSPVNIKTTTTFANPVVFGSDTFAANIPVDISYRFHSFRPSYLKLLSSSESSELWLGPSLLARLFSIEFNQTGKHQKAQRNGVVPLLHLNYRYTLNPDWRFEFDYEGIVLWEARITELTTKFSVALSEGWEGILGARLTEASDKDDDIKASFFSAGVFFGISSSL